MNNNRFKKEEKFRQIPRIILLVISLCVITIATAYAGEYQTTIDAFEYNGVAVPAYDGDPSEEVNGNLPTFTAEELTETPVIEYGALDDLGRCTTAFAELNQSLMPTGKRGSISSVKPSGWVQAKYDIVPGGWLWNRCHLIGWQLTGADLDNLTKDELSRNLITGTRYLNVGNGSTGMVEYENDVAAYLKEDADNFVSYRVTPVFMDDNLVASGVLMEGQSVAGDDVAFCVFCYNVQPEIAIDYATGESRLASALPDNRPITDCDITIGSKTVYTGEAQVIPITITDGEVVLQKGVDYETVYSSNMLPGRAMVQIAGIGSYKGAVTGHFIIIPAKAGLKSTQAGAGSIRITVNPQKGVTGYQYAWRLKGKAWKSTYYQGKTKNVTHLKKKTTYQVRVRAYKTIDGKKWYGGWSNVKTVRTK